MRLDLELTTEAVVAMVVEVVATVVEVVTFLEEDGEGIRSPGCLKILLRSQV